MIKGLAGLGSTDLLITLLVVSFCIKLIIYLANAWYDKDDDIAKGINVPHAKETAIVCGIAACISLVFFGLTKWALIDFIYFLPLRYTVFNPYLNYIRDEKLNYIGELETTTALTDKILHGLNKISNATKCIETNTSNWLYLIQVLLLSATSYSIYLIIIKL